MPSPIDRKAFARCCRDAGVEELPTFFFTTDGKQEDGAAQTVYSRMLAPAFGIAEDPATGSASGPLGCYLLHYGIVTPDAARNILSLQGVLMKRPSRIHISIDSERCGDHAGASRRPVRDGRTRRLTIEPISNAISIADRINQSASQSQPILPDHPRRHRPLTLYHRRLDRVQ